MTREKLSMNNGTTTTTTTTTTSSSSSSSSLHFALKSYTYSGLLPAFLMLCCGAVLFGLLPQFLMVFWGSYYSMLAGSSYTGLVQITLLILLQGIFYTMVERPLDFFAKALANRQSTWLRSALQAKADSNPGLFMQVSQAGQKILDCDSFFSKTNLMVKNALFSGVSVLGNFVYLARYGFFWLSVKIFALMLATDWVVYRLNMSQKWWGMAKLDQESKNAATTFRDAFNSMRDNIALYQGQEGLLRAKIQSLRAANQPAYLRTMRVKQWVSAVVNTFVSVCARLVCPLVAIFVLRTGQLTMPLGDSGTANQGVNAGVFQQILFCFTQLWRSGSVIKTNMDSATAVESSFNNIKDCIRILSYQPADGVEQVTPISTRALAVGAFWGMLQVWWLVTMVTQMLQYYQVVGALPVFVLTPLPLMPMMAANLFFSVRYMGGKSILPWAEIINVSVFSFTTAVLVVYGASFFFVGSLYYPLIQGVALATYFLALLTSCYFLQAYRRRLSCLACAAMTNKQTTFGSLSAKSSQANSAMAAELSDVALCQSYDKECVLTPLLSFAPNTSVAIPFRQASLVSGDANVGKSALIFQSLMPHFGRAGPLMLTGQRDVWADIQLVFSQQQNPMQNLARFDRDFVFRVAGQDLPACSALAKVFYTLVITNPDNMTKQDYDLWQKWPRIKADILTFLQDPDLDFAQDWRDALAADKSMPVMSGGNKAKLMSAVIAAILRLSAYQPGRSVLVGLDYAFDGISESVLPHVVAKLTACVRAVPKSALVVNLAKEKVTFGGGAKSLDETFDQILTVQKTGKEVSVQVQINAALHNTSSKKKLPCHA